MSDLLKINVNDHTERKNGLTYLSWAWAWAEVLKIDPLATWAPMFNGPQGSESPWFQLPDGSMMVGVSVVIKGHAKQCMLPVMDHRNKAIKNPDAFAVNTALMRCLAKCIAMHGLGLYIYAGEDLPEDDKHKPDGPITPTTGAEDLIEPARAAELQDLVVDYVAAWDDGKTMKVIKHFYSLTNDEQVYVTKLLQPRSDIRRDIKANSPHKEAA